MAFGLSTLHQRVPGKGRFRSFGKVPDSVLPNLEDVLLCGVGAVGLLGHEIGIGHLEVVGNPSKRHEIWAPG